MAATGHGIEPPLAFSKCICAVQECPMLSLEEELDLARRWRDRQEVAPAHRLVTSHTRLMVRIASGFRGFGVSADELIGADNSGPMHAVRRYDHDRGLRFAAYAMWWIRLSAKQQPELSQHSIGRDANVERHHRAGQPAR